MTMFPSTRTIISLCDRTGIWSQPYADAGYDVRRYDLTEGHDVRLMEFVGPVWGVIAQPPCTHLAGSGARWWEAKGNAALLEAMSVVDACLRAVLTARPRWWVLENPVGRLGRFIGAPVMTFNPNEYAGWSDDPDAEAYTKRTCLWGEFNHPQKRPVEPVLGSIMHRLPPSPDRAAIRSITPSGFARAFFEANS